MINGWSVQRNKLLLKEFFLVWWRGDKEKEVIIEIVFLLWWLNTWICNVQEKRFFHLKNKNVFRLIGVLFHSLHFLFKTIPNNKIYGKHFPPKETKHCQVWMTRIRNTKATLHVSVPITSQFWAIIWATITEIDYKPSNWGWNGEAWWTLGPTEL